MDHHDFAAAVALSVIAAPVTRGVGTCSRENGPAALFAAVTGTGLAFTQEHIAARYGNDPAAAAQDIIDSCAAAGIDIISLWHDEYPRLLREIARPPLVLYARGDVRIDHDAVIALVGTRSADLRSAAVAARLAAECSGVGYVVVSGMAAGIDRAVHQGALDAGGRTIGIMANGIDIQYPRCNGDLFQRMLATPGSGLISEYPPGIRAVKWTFARRNRIISGMARGVVVIKAGERSGALITARHALEQNREVFACPGHSFDDAYRGCHDLIRDGAHLVSQTGDITGELRANGASLYSGAVPGVHTTAPVDRAVAVVCTQPREAPEHLDDLSRRILEHLADGECDFDSLVRLMGDETARVTESVVSLELTGEILRRGNRLVRFRH